MLSEAEILDRHKTALGEARREALWLGGQQDEGTLAPRGGHYGALKRAIKLLEGSCRQMGHFRGDARWIRLSVVYAKAERLIQAKYIAQKWSAFTALAPLFERGLREVADLAERKTGVRGPIIPQRASDWLILPDHHVPQRPLAPSLRSMN